MSFSLAVLSESAPHTRSPVTVFDGGQPTYRQLDQASDRLAANLASAGIGPATGSRCNCRTFRSS